MATPLERSKMLQQFPIHAFVDFVGDRAPRRGIIRGSALQIEPFVGDAREAANHYAIYELDDAHTTIASEISYIPRAHLRLVDHQDIALAAEMIERYLLGTAEDEN